MRYEFSTTQVGDGWQCVVTDRDTGTTLHETRQHPRERDARIDAGYWAENDALTSGKTTLSTDRIADRFDRWQPAGRKVDSVAAIATAGAGCQPFTVLYECNDDCQRYAADVLAIDHDDAISRLGRTNVTIWAVIAGDVANGVRFYL